MFTSHWPAERIAYTSGLIYMHNIIHYIQQSGRSVKTMNVKNMKKSPIHENADANITCDFGDGDISRYRSRFPHTCSLARL